MCMGDDKRADTRAGGGATNSTGTQTHMHISTELAAYMFALFLELCISLNALRTSAQITK